MRLKEDSIPIDQKGRPDLSHYTESVEYYSRMYENFLATMARKPLSEAAVNLAWRLRGHATWGLIAKGSDGIDYALKMLKSRNADAREDAGGILAAIGRDDAVIDKVIASLAQETDTTAIDSMILALGEMKSRRAISSLATFLRDADIDGDTRHTAAESLGRIVRRRFLKEADPVRAALDWLELHPDEEFPKAQIREQ